ncbi:MAG: serine/threonine-protein kinase [Pseudomonadota bacterium]
MDDELTERARGRVGLVINEKYRIDEVLGVGGTAAVFAATHRNGHRVALKMLHRELSQRDVIRSRFLREGYLANRVAHRAVARVTDDDVERDGSAYLVMELLSGSTVEGLLEAQGGRLDLELTLGIADATLDVLGAAHVAAVIHRDIKPANLFLTKIGELKILDFGVARLMEGASITGTGELWGTAAFMPPEQALGDRTLDHRCDLWAVGAVIFRLLSGRDVHRAANDHQQMLLAATQSAPRLASVAPQVPSAVCAIVDKALMFNREDRWPSAQLMQSAIRKTCEYERL